MRPLTKWGEANAARFKTVIDVYPGILNGMGRRLLYVGCMPWRHDFLDILLAFGWDIDVLEIYEPYISALRCFEGPKNIIHGDATVWRPGTGTVYKPYRSDDMQYQPGSYHTLWWWHGPEHVTADKAAQALEQQKKYVTETIVWGVPYGDSPSGPTDGNEANRHVSTWWGPELQTMGFQTSVLSDNHRNITAVMRICG